MNRSLFSRQWYRVAGLRPRLRSHAEIHRNIFRGEIWFVVEDHATGAFQRISQAAYRMVGLMNGDRTVDEIWRAAGEILSDDLPTQDDVINLLVRLHQADLLHAEIPSDMKKVVKRSEKTERRKQFGSVRNPLSIRLPLFDPDDFLRATLWFVRPFFSLFGAILWIAVVVGGAFAAATHWDSLSGNVSDSALTVGNIALLVAIYPVVKILHEFGHAYTVRQWGGEVHEIGIMFLVFMPVPYVDASASYRFRSKWQRAGVAFAGVAVEVFLAGLAAILWTALEPGLLRAAMMNVMLLGGISTLLFNGNPLLRFDGYYALTDIVEIPNLGSRSSQHLTAVLQHHILGMKDAVFPAMARGEALWFTIYGLISLVYRYLVMAAITLFIASRFFEVGLALAVWTLALLLAVPVAKGIWFVLASPRLDRNRGRALAISGGLVSVLIYALFIQPVPQATVVEGVVVAPQPTVANAGAEGFVAELLARPGETLAAGTPILRIEDPLLESRVAVLNRRIQETELRRLQNLAADPIEALQLGRERRFLEEEMALARERLGEQILRAPKQGRLILPGSEELVGRYVHKGETLAWTVDEKDPRISAVVTQRDIDLVRRRIDAVSVRPASNIRVSFPASILQANAGAAQQLPSPALGTAGGGRIALDPRTSDGVTPLETVFLIDLQPSAPELLGQIGERVYVRFEHGQAPLGFQLWRAMRQIFLRDLNV